MAVIVDTNVPMVANSTTPEASLECVNSCGKHLQSITEDFERLVLDTGWEVISEYRRGLNSAGQPGVGDAFFKWVLTNWSNPQRCDLISIERVGFPNDPALNGFDLSDRKFVQLNLAHPDRPHIWNAVDTDWWNFRHALAAIGVMVDFLCHADIQALARRKGIVQN